MSYLVLARKYRPRVFADVVGQEVVTGTLRGAIAEGRIGHAYLFCGPRGTGKTTTARIFAKALNCEKGPAPDPCGTCERCLAADNGSEIDIIEVDAASHTGVDYVREMREQAAYMPLRARFKIYLIDEVHMLSKGAFNALLKTLEEPPPHVKFLFATTELERLPETIVSRCQLLRLVPLNERTIVDRLGAVFDAEGVKAEPGVTAEIARRARGGMRDALSLADQLLSLSGNELEVADLAQLAGDGGADELDRLLDVIEAGDMPQILTLLPASEGGEVELTAGLLDHLRGTLLVHLCGEATPLLELELGVRQRMRARAQRLGIERMQIWLEELLQARERMRLVPGHARLILEVTLLDLARPETSLSLADISERLLALEQRLESRAGPAAEPRMTPRASAPTDGRASAPMASRASAPGDSRASAPGDNRASASADSRASARADNRANASADGRANAPADSRASAPGDSRASASADSRASAPMASRASAPADGRASAPADARSNPPSAARADSPPKSAGSAHGANAAVARQTPNRVDAQPLQSTRMSGEMERGPAASVPAPASTDSSAQHASSPALPTDRNILQPRPRPETIAPRASASSPPPAVNAEIRPHGTIHEDPSSSGETASTNDRPNPASANEPWNRCLATLRAQMPGLADLLQERGKLAESSGTRAVVKLGPLDEDERLMIADARNARACSRALSNALGRTVEIVFEGAAPEPKVQKDSFTSHVSDLFGGRIEDDL